jgi:hypothetical protein
MKPDGDFPRLTPENHRQTSPSTVDYNCIAWAAGDTGHWWQPGVHWPIETPSEDYGIGVLVDAFKAIGFEPCSDGGAEPGFEKVALYGNTFVYTHAARQLPGGKWTSKLGRSEDIEHDTPDVVAGGIYGEVVEIMRRPSGTDL